MNKEQLRANAQRMLARAHALGLKTAAGSPVVVDQMEELLAAVEGYRNVHAYKSALRKREAPALVPENPDESGSDYKLVAGRGCWISMGNVLVHPYLTADGVRVDLHAKGDAFDPLASAELDATDVDARPETPSTENGAAGTLMSAPARVAEMKETLENIGFNIDADSDQPGRWVWTVMTEGCDSSFESEAEAVVDAWGLASRDAQSANDLSTKQWAALTFEEQKKYIEALADD